MHYRTLVIVSQEKPFFGGAGSFKKQIAALLEPYREKPDERVFETVEEIEAAPILDNQSYWDYWEIGGSYNGVIPRNYSRIRDLPGDFSTYAIVTPDGKWFSKNPPPYIVEFSPTWPGTMAVLLAKYRDWWAVMVDCHI